MDAERCSTHTFHVAATVVLLIAAAFRFWGLADLPPGLHQDEAVYGVNALTVLEGNPQIYYGEREPLYMYVAAAAFFLAGPTTFALRLASAAVGMIAVAAGGALATRLFGRGVGLLTAFGLATSLWLVPLSRIGFRAITFPAVEALALALLWKAVHTRHPRDYVLAGVLLGFSLYTYLAVRFLPIALALFFLLVILRDAKWLRERTREFALTCVAATLVCLPLGAYFVRHPEAIYGRAQQVALAGDQPFVELAANALRTVGMIAWRGDGNWRHNLGGAPVFDPLWTLFLAVGVVVALRRRTPAHLLALVLASVMLVPSALSIDSPHYLRTLGAATALYALAALGIVVVARIVSRRWGTTAASAAVTLAVVAAFVRGAHGYFVTYAASPEVPRAFNADLAAAGRYLASSPTWQLGRDRVFVTDRFLQDRASVAFFLYPLLAPGERARWLEPQVIGTFYDEEAAIPLCDGPALYLAAGDGARLVETLGSAIATTDVQPLGGGLQLRVFQTSGPASPAVDRAVSARFRNWLTLEGASIRGSTVMLLWSTQGAPPGPRDVFIHLRDRDGHVLEGGDTRLPGTDPSRPWPRRFVTWHQISPPPGTPPGTYELEVGVYDRASGRRETVQLSDHTDARVPLGQVRLDRLSPGEIAPRAPLSVQAWPGLTLVGIDLPETPVASGAPIPIALYWRADSAPLPDFFARVHLQGANGVEQGFRLEPPAPDYPTSLWKSGDVVKQFIDVRSRPDADGELRVLVQVSTAEEPGEVIDVGVVVVEAPERTFTPPEVAHRFDAEFEDVGQLYGYDVAPGSPRPGDVLVVTLHWIAKGDYSSDETVFVHLTDATGRIRAQRDSPPDGGRRPTSTWIAGEVIVDRYEIALPADLPPGTYVLKVGLYDPVTGRRVAVVSGQGGDHVEIGTIEVGAQKRE